MHIVTNDHPVSLPRGRTLEPGRWIFDNINAAELLAKNPCCVNLRPFESLEFIPNLKESLLIVRPGGLGDLVMLTPVLRELKKQGRRIGVATLQNNAVVLEGLKYVDEIVPYPIDDRKIDGVWDQIISLEDILEYHPEAHETHALDLFCKELFGGLEIEDKRPEYRIRPEEIELAWERFPKPDIGGLINNKLRVGVQMAASSPVRTYARINEVIARLAVAGHQVFVFGEPGTHKLEFDASFKHRANITATMDCDPPLSFRESVALAYTCDGIVTPDSSMVHVAGALGIPCVALYASFPWQIRTKYYPSVRALTGNADCAPCCFHGRGSIWPKGQPCERAGRCVALDNIDSSRVVAALEKQIQEVKR